MAADILVVDSQQKFCTYVEWLTKEGHRVTLVTLEQAPPMIEQHFQLLIVVEGVGEDVTPLTTVVASRMPIIAVSDREIPRSQSHWRLKDLNVPGFLANVNHLLRLAETKPNGR